MKTQSGRPAYFPAYDYAVKALLVSLLISIAAAQILAGLIAIVLLWSLLRGSTLPRTPLDLPVLIFMAVRIIAVVFARDVAASSIALSREVPFYLLFYCFSFYVANATEREIKSTVKWLLISTAAVAIIAGIRTLLGQVERANAFTGGGTLATHATMVVALLLACSNWKLFTARWIEYAILAAVLFGLALSFTRGEWLASGAALAIYYGTTNRRLFAAVAGLAVVLILVVPQVRGRVMTLLHPMENTSDRLTLWENASNHLDEHPIIGFGPESFHQVFDDQAKLGDPYVASWHNDFIQTYMEAGAVGVASWLLLFGSLAVQSSRLLRLGPGAGAIGSVAGWLGLLLLVSYIIGGFFSIPTYQITNGMLFKFLIAFVAVGAMQFRQSDSETQAA